MRERPSSSAHAAATSQAHAPVTSVVAAPSRFTLTVEEACRELHMCRASLFKLLARGPAGGGIGSIRPGKRRLIPVREIEAFIARQLESEGVI